MSFFINWLNAIGALIIFGLIYNDVILINPLLAGFMSLMALVFMVLSYVLRVNAMKMVPLGNWQGLAGLVLVLVVVAASVYFVVPQVQLFTIVSQYVVLGWMGLLNVLIIIESLLAFRNSDHPLLEGRLRILRRREKAHQ